MFAGGDETARWSTTSPASTSVVLVTELIRLTLKKLQTALEENRIDDDDLVAMATAVDAGAVSAALRARHGSATARCSQASRTPPPVSRQTSHDVAIVSCDGRGAVAATTSDDRDRLETVPSSVIAAVAKKVISDVLHSLAEQ